MQDQQGPNCFTTIGVSGPDRRSTEQSQARLEHTRAVRGRVGTGSVGQSPIQCRVPVHSWEERKQGQCGLSRAWEGQCGATTGQGQNRPMQGDHMINQNQSQCLGMTGSGGVDTSDANWKPKSWSSKKCPMSNSWQRPKFLDNFGQPSDICHFFVKKHAQVCATQSKNKCYLQPLAKSNQKIFAFTLSQLTSIPHHFSFSLKKLQFNLKKL